MKLETKPQAVNLQDYKKPEFEILDLNLDFDLFEEKAVVIARSKVKKSVANADLFLNGEELKLLSIQIDDNTLDPNQYDLKENGITITNPPNSFVLTIKTEIFPQNNKAFSGLYKTKNIFCTQMEAQGFRRVTYFLDRPDVMTTYTTTVRADEAKYPLLLSNGNLIDHKKLADGRHECTWHDPFRKPCYLFALVAGDLGVIKDQYKTKSGKVVELRIYVDKGNEPRAQHAMESLKKSMRWDEDVFRLEYDLNIYMIVAVDDFNMGAMENKGLNIFNSRLVIADIKSATDTEFIDIESVIGHEYFHNWSGNRVTCRDWFQLSLKEGLTVFRDQEFSADMNSRDVNRIQDVDRLRTLQFPEDSGPMAHPIRPQSYISIDNFYTLTVYEKGAEVIRMIYQLLGHEKFHQGMDLYFSTHDGQAVTTEDFLFCMQKASGVDLTLFSNWYHQAGTPHVEVLKNYNQESKTLTLTFKQKTIDPVTKKENQPYHIPIKMGLLSKSGKPFELITNKNLGIETTIELKKSEDTFVFKNLPELPITSLLREFTSPIKLKQDLSTDELLTIMKYDSDAFNRWEASQNLYLQELLLAHQSPQNEVNPKLIKVMEEILLSPNGDRALLAQLINLPVINYFMQFCNPIEPDKIISAYKSMNNQIAFGLKKSLIKCYDTLKAESQDKINPESMAYRALKNTVLAWLGKTQESSALELAFEQFKNSTTMTDKLGALEVLSHHQTELKDEALRLFRNEWKHDNLVMNKWFRIQALAQTENAFEQIKKLTFEPEFDKTNPNKIYSLIMAFGNFNFKAFHRQDGLAYSFLADWVIDVDSRNPQVASRVVSALNQWKKFSEPYSIEMKKSLEKILANPKISKNVFEIADRAFKN